VAFSYAIWLFSATTSSGLPFDPWIAPTELMGAYRLVVDPPDDRLYTPDADFIEEQE